MWPTLVERRRYQIEGRRLVPRQLAACYGEEWYDNPAAGLDRGLASHRRRAANAVERLRPADTAPYFPSLEQIVAEANR